MRVLVVSGTGTGVGKTVVAAALAALAAARGQRVAVVKPVQTGQPADIDEVRRLSGLTDVHELARYPEPLAPATAARRARLPGMAPAAIAAAVERLRDRDLVLVEGAGGLLVRFDDEGGTIADVARLLCAPVIVVVRAGLGTLNETALTCEALRARGLACRGVVVGAWPADPDLAARCNVEDLASYAGAPLVGRLPEGAGRMGREELLATAQETIELEVHA